MTAPGLRLYLLRHGRADRSAFAGDDDSERPLVAEGRRRLRAAANVLARLQPDFDYVFTSPLVRAAQTAEIIAEKLGLTDRQFVDQRLAPGFDVPTLLDILTAILAERQEPEPVQPVSAEIDILLVGHEPDFRLVIQELTGADVVMKKGALARIDLAPNDPNRGKLVWLLQPRVLMSLDR